MLCGFVYACCMPASFARRRFCKRTSFQGLQIQVRNVAACPVTHLGAGQIYCIFLFITGASVFGLLISHFNETMEAENRANREMEDVMDPYLSIRPR